MPVTRTLLSDNWRVREVPRSDIPPHNQLPWIPAQVPGQVHLDLVRGGVIAEPFYRMQERDVAWVDETDWEYETTFEAPADLDGAASLLFHGLDTLAEVELNGEVVGRAENMFVSHEMDVTGKLKIGENTLRVTFRSAKKEGERRQAKWNEGPDACRFHWDNFAPRSFVRKAQYMYGWDWGPVLISCGLWQPVELITGSGRIGDWQFTADLSDPAQAMVTITAGASGELTATLRSPSGETYTGVGSGAVHIEVPAPALWQPNGAGAANLYDLTLSVAGGETKSARVGFKTVVLVQEPDATGSGNLGFKFRVNSRDLFMKGANWIPNDSFPGRITEAELRARLTQARDAGMNMLRVWGGGLYETEEFYNICDELGILVWQDFAYGCAYYPDTGEYAEQARVEATAAARRIRNHASLALWCGNNENLTMFVDNWGAIDPPRYLGEHIYNEILPSVVSAENPEIPYWASSPMGGDPPNSDKSGDCHNWDVWHGRGDWTHYTENDTPFCSEFGFASSCGLAAWNTVLAEGDREPFSPVVQWHDKTRKGYETYLGYTLLHFPGIKTLEDLVYFSQINQAEALKYGIEHYRRRMGHCWGTLFWQLNDCWPVQSWATIDYLGEPKAAHYWTSKFYAPTLLSLFRPVVNLETGERSAIVEAHLVSDLDTPQQGNLTISLMTFTGEALAREEREAATAANGAALVASFDDLAGKAAGREAETYITAVFEPFDTKSARLENILLLTEPKALALPLSHVRATVQGDADGKLTISVSAQSFAPYVWLRCGEDTDAALLRLSDNFFHLQPGEIRKVEVLDAGGLTAEELQHRLIIRSLQP